MTVLSNEVLIEKLALQHYFDEAEASGGQPMQPSGSGVVVDDHLVTISDNSKVLARYIWSGADDDIEFTDLSDREILEAAWRWMSDCTMADDSYVDIENIVTILYEIPQVRLVVGSDGVPDFVEI